MWSAGDIYAWIVSHGERLSRVEERQTKAVEDISRQGQRIDGLERKIDQATKWIGVFLLAFLLLVNLPPEISGPIVKKLLVFVPG